MRAAAGTTLNRTDRGLVAAQILAGRVPQYLRGDINAAQLNRETRAGQTLLCLTVTYFAQYRATPQY